MSNVKRYDLMPEGDGLSYMETDEHGEYVKHDDYKALALRLDTCQAELAKERHFHEKARLERNDAINDLTNLQKCRMPGKSVAPYLAQIATLQSRLDSLSAAVRKAWDAHREGDMWKALGGAMDIVDPERNEQPIRAVERGSRFVMTDFVIAHGCRTTIGCYLGEGHSGPCNNKMSE